ncbi:MAG: YbaN family protein [Planctomycetota bacterium]
MSEIPETEMRVGSAHQALAGGVSSESGLDIGNRGAAINHDPQVSPDAASRPAIRRTRIERWLLVGIGVGCVGLGGLGVFVPGLPTTVFLIIASACFVRSCPWLEERLLRNRLFAPYMRYVDGRTPMPFVARVAIAIAIWASVGISLTTLALAGGLAIWLGVAIVLAAAVGTAFVFAWKPAPAIPAQA